jgi:hypothetical protein
MINKTSANRLANVARLMPFIMAPALVCFAPVARGAEPLPDRQWRLGNDQLELQFVWKDNRVVVHRLLNRLSGRTIPITGDDFSFGIEGRQPLRAADFAFQEVREAAIPGGRRLTLQSNNAEPGARLDVIYELGEKDFVIRRRLELLPVGPLQLRQVEVWRAGLMATCSAQEEGPPVYLTGNVWKVEDKKGFGLPVFLDDTFWGLEYPAGYNRYEQGVVSLRHCPGRTITNKFVSKTAVLGVARPRQVTRAFRHYIETLQAAPSDRLMIGFNTWAVIEPTERNCLEFIDLVRRKMYDPYGVGLDFFALDDGWDKKDSLWEIRSDRLPRGFTPLLEALQPMKTRLGLWLSPSTGYDHAGWGGANGYPRNASFDWFLCQSAPNYRRDMARVVGDLKQRYDPCFFKLDGFMASCDTASHPHHLGGDYAREANVDAVEELFAVMRKTDHPVHLDPTSGMWLSPWWLRTADSIYADTYDGEPPTIAPAPNFREGATTSRDAQYRLRCRQNPWFPSCALETLDIYHPTTALGHNDVMATIARGQRLVNVYADLRRFSDADWRFLASAFQWARHNAATLSHTELLPGDPLKGEPYGLAHFHGRRGILSLRNPSIQPQKIQVRLDESSGWFSAEAHDQGAARDFVARIVYPRQEVLDNVLKYGDTLELDLEAHEQMVVEIEPADEHLPRLSGVRAREAGRQGNTITWEVFAAPGGAEALLHAKDPPARVLLDGKEVTGVTKVAGGLRIPLAVAGTKNTCQAADATLSWTEGGNGKQLVGRCKVDASPGIKTWVVLLCHSQTNDAGAMQCKAQVNNKPANVSGYGPEHHPPHKLLYREFTRQSWKWFQFELPGGPSDVVVTIDFTGTGATPKPFEAAWWLLSEQPLTKAILTLEFSRPLPAAPVTPLPYPSDMEFRCQVQSL